MTTTVLVSGVGAVTGYGVLRSLRQHEPTIRLLGTDIHPHAIGQHWCDNFELAPPVASERFPAWLASLVERHRVTLFIPTLEAELTLFHERPDLVDSLGCLVALPGTTVLTVSRDKWMLDELLRETGDPARIRSSVSGDFRTLSRELGVPFVVKPRRGFGSRGVAFVSSEEMFTEYENGFPDRLFAQAAVGSVDTEFTVAVFGDGSGRVSARIVLRRWLSPDGMTIRARSEPMPAELATTIERLCGILHPVGATNLQFREHDGEFKLLEVNGRVSSSTSLRTRFGYNEAGMVADYYVHGVVPSQPALRYGEAIRYIEDHVLFA